MGKTRLVRLRSDWMLIELEPELKVTRGGLVKPDTHAEPVRVGRVLMAGPGREYTDTFVPMPEDIVGQRVAFLIAASQTKQGQSIRSTLSLDDNHEIIRLGDVLLVVEEGVEVSR